MTSLQLVWFKRDLRLRDHAPLAEAAARGPVLAIYVHEPAFRAAAEYDAMHQCFLEDCLDELQAGLAQRGVPLLELHGELPALFEALQRVLPFATLWAHEETGQWWTFQRDLAVARWCRERGIEFIERPQTGVIRRLRSRDGWARRWEQRMRAAEAVLPSRIASVPLPQLERVRTALAAALVAPRAPQAVRTAPRAAMQRGGESRAWATLARFLDDRGVDYRRGMSSPLTAFDACSRISPYLAWGALSTRAVLQRLERRAAQLDALRDAGAAVDRRWAGSLQSFGARLRWHCHFMQKLEDEPRIEFENFSRAYDGLRESQFDRARFDAWCAGATGYPLVDACMRALHAGGWINFRMRAMLVSFAAYHLWLHWREPAQFLARHFIDYEPGIHYSQFQMQSGTTGINTVRIYSPLKQQLDQDPAGEFVRRWLPELQAVPAEWLTRLAALPDNLQRQYGVRLGRDYPRPVVEHEVAIAAARERLHALRRTPTARAAAQAVQQRHGSRRSGLPQTASSARRGRPAGAARPIAAPGGAPVQARLDFAGESGDDGGP
jgi:deoxyribodipyrimidine photo-lyase